MEPGRVARSAYTASRSRACRNPSRPARRTSSPSVAAASSASSMSAMSSRSSSVAGQRSTGGRERVDELGRRGGGATRGGADGDPEVGGRAVVTGGDSPGRLDRQQRVAFGGATTRSSASSSSRCSDVARAATAPVVHRCQREPRVTGTPRPARSASIASSSWLWTAVAEGEHEQQWQPGKAPTDVTGQPQAGPVGAVRVVEDDHGRPVGAGPLDQTQHRLEDAQSFQLGRRHRGRGTRVAEPRSQVAREPVQLERPRGGGRHRRGRGDESVAQLQPGGERRLAGDVHSDGHAGATAGRLDAADELGDQAGLADAASPVITTTCPAPPAAAFQAAARAAISGALPNSRAGGAPGHPHAPRRERRGSVARGERPAPSEVVR